MLSLTLRSHMGLWCVYTIITILAPLLQPTWQHIQQSHYKVIKDTKFQDATTDSLLLSTGRLQGPIGCSIACNFQVACTSVIYDLTHKTCQRNQHDIYTFGRQNLTSSKSVNYLGRVQQDITAGNWTLVFRGQANNSLSMWKSFTNSSLRSDLDMANINPAFSSVYPDVTLPHFRSRWLDLWPSDTIDLVKVQLYKNGRAEVNLTFNGTGSNQTDWFSMSRLVEASPYTDLGSNYSQFIIYRKMKQIFVISNTSDFSLCSQHAWLIVEDLLSNVCYWSSMNHWPRILYSGSSNQVDFNNRSQLYREADILAMFVKFHNQPGG